MSPSSLSLRTGLVVADPVSGIGILRGALETTLRDIRWHGADNLHDAIAIALRTLPDLIVLDVMLNGGPGGIAACRRLRGEAGLSQTKFILVAGSGPDSVVRAGYEAGAHAVLIEPVGARRLADEIQRCLGRD